MLTSLLWRPRWPASPVPVYLLFSGATALFSTLVFTLNLVYQATVVGLSPFQLVLVGTVLEATCFLFEVPTGIVADLYSRRLSIIIGFVLIGTGFLGDVLRHSAARERQPYRVRHVVQSGEFRPNVLPGDEDGPGPAGA